MSTCYELYMSYFHIIVIIFIYYYQMLIVTYYLYVWPQFHYVHMDARGIIHPIQNVGKREFLKIVFQI